MVGSLRAVGDGESAMQGEIDEITPARYAEHLANGVADVPDAPPALRRYDAAFRKVLDEIGTTAASRNRPAVWYVYNMGIVVKTAESLFAVDLHHRLAPLLAPKLDFALVTHNHGDHCTGAFLREMDRLGKPVVSNFLGGSVSRKYYSHHPRTLEFRDVRVAVTVSDHNQYLREFVTPYEISAGDFTIFHSGDTCSAEQVSCTRPPDLWFVHPYVGLDVAEGARRLRPKLTQIVHLHEFGHARDQFRWTFADGWRACGKVRDAGFAAAVPNWGECI